MAEERAAVEPDALGLTELDAALTEIDGLRQALETRTVIGQAVGILMHREALTADAAFAQLVELSSHTNTKVRDVAHDVVAKAERDATCSGPPFGVETAATRQVGVAARSDLDEVTPGQFLTSPHRQNWPAPISDG